MTFGLSPQQKTIGDRVIAEESARREHLVVYLSGAHAYGFPSPDSDLDLKAIHIAKTSTLVGLEPPQPTFDRAEVIEGVEIDYTSNELAHALAGILHGNGNFLERMLGRAVLAEASIAKSVRPLVKATLSRRVHKHYRGFSSNQLRFLEKEPTNKKLLYVLRTAMTGTHLLLTGELEADLGDLLERYDLGDARALIEAKKAGERSAVDPKLLETWRPRLDVILSRLDKARDESILPEEPPADAVRALEAWLVEVRRSRF